MKPILYIIAGCNGAGKTTASYSVLPVLLKCREFINADESGQPRIVPSREALADYEAIKTSGSEP